MKNRVDCNGEWDRKDEEKVSLLLLHIAIRKVDQISPEATPTHDIFIYVSQQISFII